MLSVRAPPLTHTPFKNNLTEKLLVPTITSTGVRSALLNLINEIEL